MFEYESSISQEHWTHPHFLNSNLKTTPKSHILRSSLETQLLNLKSEIRFTTGDTEISMYKKVGFREFPSDIDAFT